VNDYNDLYNSHLEGRKMKKIFILVACMVLLAASMSHATSFTTTFDLGTRYSEYGGGSIDSTSLGGNNLAWDYCMDYPLHIAAGGSYSADVNTAGIIYGGSKPVENALQIAYLLHTYAQSGTGTPQNNLQMAIWEELGQWSYTSLSVAAKQLVEEASLNTANYIDNFYWISPYSMDTGQKEYVQAQVGPAPVPEPAAMILFGLGMAGLVLYGKRKKSTQAETFLNIYCKRSHIPFLKTLMH
jgi:PEP-CTERM motif